MNVYRALRSYIDLQIFPYVFYSISRYFMYFTVFLLVKCIHGNKNASENNNLLPVAYAGFSKGWAGNLKIMKTKRKISPLRISPFSCPKLGEDPPKKGLHPDSVRLCAQTFCPIPKGREARHTLHTILCKSYYSGDPKGGMAPCPPFKYAPVCC